MKKNTEQQKKKEAVVVDTLCKDKHCPQHGSLSVRGRVFQGTVIAIFPRRLTMMFDRVIYVRKYERYMKARTKIHARVPQCMQHSIAKGDLVRIQETRPLSKIIHHVLIGIVKKGSENVGGKI